MVDADGLYELEPFEREAATVLTPHSGELGRLLGEEAAWVDAHRLEALGRAVERFGCVVLLKGEGTLVGAPGTGALVCGGFPSSRRPGPGTSSPASSLRFSPKAWMPGSGRLPRRQPTLRLRSARATGRASSRATCSSRFRASSMHRSEITIDLGALRRNVRRLREVLGDSELWAVVKADAYGHGAIDVAGAVLGEGAKVLCVATTGEALELRGSFPTRAS